MSRYLRKKHSGISLTEVVISTMLVGLVLVSALKCVGAVIRARTGSADQLKAYQLACQLSAEILASEYLEPDATPAFGIESPETSSSRADWDDVDDYHLWTASPPQDRAGAPLANFNGWQRDVVVEWVDPADPSSTVGSDTRVKRVTVTVRFNGNILSQMVVLRSEEYSP